MFKRDYFMRQIEQMTVMLHRILFNKEHLPLEDAQKLLDEASRHLLGLNIRSLQALSSKDILELLSYHGSLDTAKALVITDMFTAQGDMLERHEQTDEAYSAYLKSLDLLLHLSLSPEVEPKDEEYGEMIARIQQSMGRLEGWIMPEDIKRLLFAHYEKQGLYAKVEDVLFHYMEDHPDQAEFLGQGVIFYEKLLEIPDDDLLAGNFSKEEALDGLRFLKQKLHSFEIMNP
ncbi:hypothetical protein GCM10008018_71860 [Paenibacillus marchantiophytorum]|uniref:Tetratricopeptide repeat protein n=1 Tax=Paenibacillus marchantiophytorum TaxID=1619310 RepID=A0ABQ1FKH2_9BACL|nr:MULTISPECIES: DUF6483 family protein [Paenibacillus]UKS27668.1 DUF6483 family protein [Paenibacillus sp. HWE-109]GGA17165.1 hypothetical protein GCM10008018_71860 [Paenibacillus marchantiophytorum]